MKLQHTLFVLLLFFTTQCFALMHPLNPDEAFKLSALLPDSSHIEVQWELAPKHYLYRETFAFNVTDKTNVRLATAEYPNNIIEFKDVLGTHKVYEHQVSIRIPFSSSTNQPFTLQVHYQGCAHTGFCYPPIDKQFTIDPTQIKSRFTASEVPLVDDLDELSSNDSPSAPSSDTAPNANGSIFLWFSQQSTTIVLLGFLGFGLLLTFTPCVLPMVPILSSIVLGKKELSTNKAFFTSLAYVLGMSLTFASAGVVAALIGQSVQAYLQNPWMIGAVCVLLLLLALSLLGCYEIHMPRALQQRLEHANQKQQSGTYLGAFLMGALATLVVSPCVTPPLIGALTYIAHSGDIILGAAALFIMGLGMGIPLIAVATVGTRYLPKSGSWMNGVKVVMGLLLLSVVMLLLTRIVPGPIGLLGWALLALITALYLGLFSKTESFGQILRKALAMLLVLYATLLSISAGLGHDDPLHPLAPLVTKAQTHTLPHQGLNFKTVTTSEALSQALAEAKAAKQWVMVDFWAKWCLSCKIMDQTTFQDARVVAQLSSWHLIKVDITKNSHDSRKVQQDHRIIAPPVLLFYNPEGIEQDQYRRVGEISAKSLRQHLAKIQKEVGSGR